MKLKQNSPKTQRAKSALL